MLKPLMVMSALIMFELSPVPAPLGWLQEQTPAPAPLPSTAPTPTVTPGAKNPVKPTAESQARAKKLYTYDCQMCHNANGDGKSDLAKDMALTMSDLSVPSTLAPMTDQQIFELIKTGKGKMPGEGDRAKTDELWNLVIYVRGLSKEHAPEAAPKPTE